MATSDLLVLVVDDEPRMRNILQRILMQDGHKVITVSDGESALQAVEAKRPDLVLLDLVMPGMDGREVCRRIRKISTATRIIYLSAKVPANPSQSKELYCEADAFINKPATSKKILSMVSRVSQRDG